MSIYIVMPLGLAKSMEKRSFINSPRALNWGYAAYERTDVLEPRGVFEHDFLPEELNQPPMTTNPNVFVLDELPADWRWLKEDGGPEIGAMRSQIYKAGRVTKKHARHPIKMFRYQLTGLKLLLKRMWRWVTTRTA
jgi:hypothetical protein